ncbi:MAG: HU family DNA-binding protein [Candidatus Desulfofervidaceae bacterium]|nr:HU family DNA-binding protein [Candidatus Desulfofervidaceae bacterium]
MTKTEFINKVAAETGLTKKNAARAVDAVFKVLEDTLKSGENVVITGFGSFKVVERAARKGKNPQTGEPIEIPAKKVVKFKAGKKLAKVG